MTGKVRKAIQGLVDSLLLRLSKSIKVDGLWIGTFCDEDQHKVLSRVESALALIKANDAQRYRRVIASFDRIWVSYLFGAVGQYTPELKRCQLDPKFVLSSPIEFVASTIVHEAAHARLLKVGIPYTYENRHRVEQACIRQERAFAKRLPGAEELRRWLDEKLLLEPEVWSREASSARFHAAFVEPGSGLPVWLLRWLIRAN
ncbi:hypothetical protein [Ensifer adhaerens]|uniref:hypothetical protein n=1 Tax=Ensifer adhaerens TaxID=106592 RepID=UPI00098F5178|nr:hypothetical protein [Ensifer adhaerens]